MAKPLIVFLFNYLLFVHAKEPCMFEGSNLTATCSPCGRDHWLEMVKPDTGDETITNEEKTCFNNDPITVYHGNEQFIGDGSTVMGTGDYKVALNLGPRGFLLRKDPFFRYAYLAPASDPSPPSSPGESTMEYFDLNDVKKYFVRKNSFEEQMEADFQLLEWPGATAEVINQQLNSNSDKFGARCDKSSNEHTCKKYKKWMLQFERDNGKIAHYRCNSADGTNIAAVASIRKTNTETITKTFESAQHIWISHGNTTFLNNNYIQPLYVPQYILEKMAKTEGPVCQLESDLWDLRTVMDFTFTKDRLILGMKCGILIVGQLASSNLTFKVALLQSEMGYGYNKFSEPINRVSASTCCLSAVLCGKDAGLVAAYSFNKDRQTNENKFIYISSNYGDTFEQKIVAKRHSPMNLIKGLYKLYEQWHDYYEILHNPDDDDLNDDENDELLKNLRARPNWYTSTTEEKEKLFSIGTRSGRKKATLKKIVQILEDRVPKRRDRRISRGESLDMSPEWLTKIIDGIRKKSNWSESWTDENCDEHEDCKKLFENDVAVDWILNKTDIHIKIPKRNPNEPFCKEITSMVLLTEERHIIALCQIGYEKLDDSETLMTIPSSSDFGYYALYNFPIKANIPLMYGYRVSQRIFKCKYIKNTMDPNNEFIVQPEILRMEATAAIFIFNCDGAIYLSTNFGNTLFNTAFYYEQETVEKYCKQDSNYVPPTASNSQCEDEKNRPKNPSVHYLRTFRLCALNVPPIFASDSSGYHLLVTFGKFYAYGAISYNRETRLVVGEGLREMQYERRFENLLFPTIDRNGNIVLTVSLARAYSIPNSNFKDVLYQKKHSIRLVQMPLPLNRDARNFYHDNLAMCKQAKQKKFGFPLCKTSSYSIYPKRLDMDVGEVEYIQVEVKDEDPFLPLWIFSSHENSISVRTFYSLREGSNVPNLNMHNWKIEVTAKPNKKREEDAESFVDAFFGSDYNKLNEDSSLITFVNKPNVRCHVRPSSIVNIEMGCKEKKLVAHEDKYRPQCKYFRNSFNYTLRKGKYDPDLANSWIASSNNQSRSLFKINSNGDLTVTYDYVNWGCPVEPFRSDQFIPDLRILEQISENDTTIIRPYQGKFVLIEIFGAKGFSYTKKVSDMDCIRAPQNLQHQITSWKHRQRLVHLASERIKFPKTARELDNLNFTEDIHGNQILKNGAVLQHINIWNRANYLSCYEHDADSSNSDIPSHILNREYEIMSTRKLEESDGMDEMDEVDDEIDTQEFEKEQKGNDASLNEVMWGKDHARVYLFLAVAIDEYGSLCDYHTLFGVSLKTVPDMDDLHSFLIFLFFLFVWLAIVIGGYHFRKKYLKVTHMNKAKAERLEQAAWSIIYRYEKLIHGNAMDALFQSAPENDGTTMNLAARTANDKRRAELRMKKTHILAQEQARHERLQKLFQKQ